MMRIVGLEVKTAVGVHPMLECLILDCNLSCRPKKAAGDVIQPPCKRPEVSPWLLDLVWLRQEYWRYIWRANQAASKIGLF